MSYTKGFILAAALATIAESKQVKFGVLTDIHLNPYYKAYIDVGLTWCNDWPDKKTADKKAQFGRPGCDSP